MDIEKILSEKSKEIDKIIEKYIPRKYNKKTLEFTIGKARYEYNAAASNEAISKPIWEFLDRGGKRWRPVLFMLVLEALGGNIKKYKDFVIIPELVHNGTIMIDDIEDDSELRRGKPCAHKLWGVDVAINAGNAMYYLPLLTLLRNKTLDDQRAIKIYETYTQEMINISFGQGMDIVWHRNLADANKITEKEYLQMCAYKTGTLARMATKIAALLAGAEEKTIEQMGRLGESIGVAFQIQDDILNLVGEEFQKGKGIGEDIHEGKRTLMVIYTLSKANKKDKSRLLEILKMHTSEQSLIREAIEIMKKYNAIDYAREHAKNIVKETWKEVNAMLKPSPAKEQLKAFAQFAIQRKI